MPIQLVLISLIAVISNAFYNSKISRVKNKSLKSEASDMLILLQILIEYENDQWKDKSTFIKLLGILEIH